MMLFPTTTTTTTTTTKSTTKSTIKIDTDLLGCDVRVYNPRGLPVRDPALEKELKVVELRALTHWSDGHMWVSPEMHGTITGVFKNQIDWIPLNTGSVRPTQGKTW